MEIRTFQQDIAIEDYVEAERYIPQGLQCYELYYDGDNAYVTRELCPFWDEEGCRYIETCCLEDEDFSVLTYGKICGINQR